MSAAVDYRRWAEGSLAAQRFEIADLKVRLRRETAEKAQLMEVLRLVRENAEHHEHVAKAQRAVLREIRDGICDAQGKRIPLSGMVVLGISGRAAIVKASSTCDGPPCTCGAWRATS